VQQVMLFAQILLLHVTVQVAAQCLIVSHALILMVYADIQHVVVILAVMHMIMVLHALPVKLVAVAPVLHLCRLEPLASIALRHIIVATGPVLALLPPPASIAHLAHMDQLAVQMQHSGVGQLVAPAEEAYNAAEHPPRLLAPVPTGFTEEYK